MLIDEIGDKRRLMKSLREQVDLARKETYSSVTFMRRFIIRTTISRAVSKLEKKTRFRQNKKLDNLVSERNKLLGLAQNPNTIVTNLSNHTFWKY